MYLNCSQYSERSQITFDSCNECICSELEINTELARYVLLCDFICVILVNCIVIHCQLLNASKVNVATVFG